MLLMRGLSETPETVQDIDIIPDCTPERDDKILFLRTPHTLVTGHGEIKSALIRKLTPYWLVFTGLKHATEATVGGGGGEKTSTVLTSF